MRDHTDSQSLRLSLPLDLRKVMKLCMSNESDAEVFYSSFEKYYLVKIQVKLVNKLFILHLI